MTKPTPVRQSPTEPRQVRERLEAEQQPRARQRLAQMALHFRTAHGQVSHTEDSLGSPSRRTLNYELTTSHAPR